MEEVIGEPLDDVNILGCVTHAFAHFIIKLA